MRLIAHAELKRSIGDDEERDVGGAVSQRRLGENRVVDAGDALVPK